MRPSRGVIAPVRTCQRSASLLSPNSAQAWARVTQRSEVLMRHMVALCTCSAVPAYSQAGQM